MSIDYRALYENFLVETVELMNEAESSILILENGFDTEAVNTLFRSYHTLKGNTGIFDLPEIQEISHTLENVLNRIRNKEIELNQELIDILLQATDLIRELVNRTETGEVQNIENILQKLSSFGEKKIPESAPEKTSGPEPTPSHPNQTPLKTKNEKIGIPSKFVKQARGQNKYLAFIRFDALGQKGKTLTELVKLLKTLEQNGALLMHGPLERSRLIQAEGAGELSPFLFYLLIATHKPPREFLENNEIIPLKIKILHSPTNLSTSSAPKNIAPAPLEAGETNTKTQNEDEAKPEPGKQGDTHIKVSLDLIDQIINLAGETVIARNEILQKIEHSGIPDLEASGKKIGRLITRLQEGIMKTRLQSLNIVFARIPRLIRDITRKNGKKIELSLQDNGVELDKTQLDAITDPITHIIRNAIDHGIESPAERIAAGKQERGLIKVKALLSGGNVLIRFEDDGRGLNLEKVKGRALSLGVIGEHELKSASPEDIQDLIFSPGFSTAGEVSELSGRGVGMDVVRTNIARIGGNVEFESVVSQGSRINITIPQTLSIINSLIVTAANRRFALSRNDIEELLICNPQYLTRVDGRQVYELRGRFLPLLNLGELMELKAPDENSNSPFIVIINTEKYTFGLSVDEILNQEEFVVKPPGEDLVEIGLYSGVGIMGDGEALLILDTPGLARFARLRPNQIHKNEQTPQISKSVGEEFLLFEAANNTFALPTTIRPILRKILFSEIEILMGREVIRHQGEIFPLLRLETYLEIKSPTPGKETSRDQEKTEYFFAVIFRHESLHLAIFADNIQNVIKTASKPEDSSFDLPGIRGQAIIEDQTVAFLDPRVLSKSMLDDEQALEAPL